MPENLDKKLKEDYSEFEANSVLKGAIIKDFEQISDDGSECKIEFVGGETMIGKTPFDCRGQFSYDVTYQKMGYSDPRIIRMIPNRLPLTLERLSNVMSICDPTYDMEEFVIESEGFDMRPDSEDQLEFLRERHPDLIEKMQKDKAGIYFTNHRDIETLLMIYEKRRTILKLDESDLSLMLRTLREDPWKLCFDVVNPVYGVPELEISGYNDLVLRTERTCENGEKAAIHMYSKWLKEDLYGRKHTVSLKSQCYKTHPFAGEGFDFLVRKKIVHVEGDNVYLAKVLLWQENIRVACEEIKNRFENRSVEEIGQITRPPVDEKSSILTQEQEDALAKIEDNAISILSGMAGTGKTTILAYMVERHELKSIVCCAPTNAAANILTDRVTKSTTIHRLSYNLDIMEKNELERIETLIIDESSLLGERLFSTILTKMVRKCKNFKRLCLVGDVSQLYSVEAGKVLKEMSSMFPTTFLKQNHRTDESSQMIHRNSIKVKEAKTDLEYDGNVFNIVQPSGNVFQDVKNVSETVSSSTAWNSHWISPFREGVRDINPVVRQDSLHELVCEGVFHVGDKILCTENYHDIGLTNGDFFFLKKILLVTEKKDPRTGMDSIATSRQTRDTNVRLEKGERMVFHLLTASFTLEKETKMMERVNTADGPAMVVKIGKGGVALKSFTLGYCSTNHQFQGSESDFIFFDLRKVSFFVNWQHIYTAISRGKKKVVILGTKMDLSTCILNRSDTRRTCLTENMKRRNPFLDDFEAESTDSHSHASGIDIDDESSRIFEAQTRRTTSTKRSANGSKK